MRSKRLQREVDDLVAQGWRIEEEREDRVVMVDREFGSIGAHLVVALLTFWWTMGVGNVAYAAYKYVTDTRRRVLWERGVACPECGTEVPEDAAYCPSCGTDVGQAAPEGSVICPECEAAVSEGSRYCSNCGSKLADTMADASS